MLPGHVEGRHLPSRKKPATVPRQAEIEVPPDDYHPSQEEMEEDVDMPNLAIEEAKARFMRPFKSVATGPSRRKTPMVESGKRDRT